MNEFNENSDEPMLLVTNVISLSEENDPEKSKNLSRKSQRQALREAYTTANRLVTETVMLEPEEDSNLDSGEENQNIPIKIGVQKYGCPFCSKIMKIAQNMKNHILIHTGEKLFACQHCGKSFNQESNLKRHIMLVHTDVRPFVCNDCGETFKLKQYLKHHATKNHSQI